MRVPRVGVRGRGSLASYVKDLDSWRAQYVIVGVVLLDFFINQLALSLAFYDDGVADTAKLAPTTLESKYFGWTVIHVGNICDAVIVFLAILSKLVLFNRESLILSPILILFRLWRGAKAVYQIMDERELLHKAEITDMEAKWQQRQNKDKERYRIIKKKNDVAQVNLRVLMGEENVYNGELDEDRLQLEEESYNIEIPPLAQFSQSFSLTQFPPKP
ncbi:hypothetical protein HK096_003274 [Nowakowskiella sp. JEL0078]|nr:hypothetical protein HK096_003274 [Nowakowskiella sp. JEL0078]